jgi:hypothetical protein
MVKRPCLTLYGNRLLRYGQYHRGGNPHFSNKMLLQTIEGMLIMDAIDESMVVDLPDRDERTGDCKKVNLTINQSNLPNLYQSYTDASYGTKDEILSGYVDIAISLWLDDSSKQRRTNYLKIARKGKSTNYLDLPAAPVPDDELPDIKAIQSVQSVTASAVIDNVSSELESVLDGMDDLSVFDEFEFDMDDEDETVDVDRYEIEDDESALNALDSFNSK